MTIEKAHHICLTQWNNILLLNDIMVRLDWMYRLITIYGLNIILPFLHSIESLFTLTSNFLNSHIINYNNIVNNTCHSNFLCHSLHPLVWAIWLFKRQDSNTGLSTYQQLLCISYKSFAMKYIPSKISHKTKSVSFIVS